MLFRSNSVIAKKHPTVLLFGAILKADVPNTSAKDEINVPIALGMHSYPFIPTQTTHPLCVILSRTRFTTMS